MEKKHILQLISTKKLTLIEVAGYLVEQSIVMTEEMLVKVLKDLIKNDHITLVKEHGSDEEFLRPALVDPLEWSKISRQASVDWINNNTNLNCFFQQARQLHNNVIKGLSVKGYHSYYQVYNPTESVMEVELNGNKGVMFASNDYLGLSRHPEVIEACSQALFKYGNGSCGSRLTIGTTDLHLMLEKKLAAFKMAENAIIFSSGYITNLSFFSTLHKDTTVFFDSLSHACIIDGIKLAGVNAIRFKHNNVHDLEYKLKKYNTHKPKLIVVEAVYSLDGDIAKLDQIAKLAEAYKAKICVDEAHSTGTLGFSGRGICEHFNLPNDAIEFKVGTLGKAIGAEGGFLCAADKVIQAYNYSARPYMFTTSRAFPVIAGAIKAVEIIENNPDLVRQLQQKALYVRQAFKALNIDIGDSETQIIPVMTYDTEKAHLLQKTLESHGIYTIAVTYPGVPLKKARVRINISAAHTQQQLDKLIELVGFYAKKYALLNSKSEAYV